MVILVILPEAAVRAARASYKHINVTLVMDSLKLLTHTVIKAYRIV